MTELKEEHFEVISSNRAKLHEMEKVQNEMDDSIEALTIIDSAISTGYLLDKHSLELQKWAKEYQDNINKCKAFLEENKWVMKHNYELC